MADTTGRRLLLVEDDPDMTSQLLGLLAGESYEVEVASDAEQSLHLGLTRAYDVVVMNRGLSGGGELGLLIQLRAQGMATPTLLLSAHGDPADRVAGLDAGAEDCLALPFDSGELLARLRALARRRAEKGRRLDVPCGVLDVAARRVTLHDLRTVRLSVRECALLATLAARPRKVFSRDELRTIVFDGARLPIVDTYVHYVRQKLGRGVVDTVRGRGYRLGRTQQ